MAEEQTEEPQFAAPTGEGEAAEKQSSACRALSCSFPGHSAQVQPTVLLPQPEERSESVTDRWLKLFLGKKNHPQIISHGGAVKELQRWFLHFLFLWRLFFLAPPRERRALKV